MCGIVAVISKRAYGFDQNCQKAFHQMLLADSFRGEDSTGVIVVDTTKDFGIWKEAEAGYSFVQDFIDSEFDKGLFKSGFAAIGHNRKATVGKVTDETAHPFVVDDSFAMVHNGTLYQHKKLANTEVDSEALAIVTYEALQQEDWKKAFTDIYSEVDGAYATIWYDQKKGQIGLFRNKERPLGMVETEEAYVIASELPMAQWIAWRNGLKIKSSKLIEEHTLYLFDVKEGAPNQAIPFALKPPSVKVTNTGKTTTSGGTKSNSFRNYVHKTKEDQSWNWEVSKNEFKRMRGVYMGTRQTFDITDYYPDPGTRIGTVGDDETLAFVAESDRLLMCHEARFRATFKEIEATEDMLIAGFQPTISGTISEMVYNKEQKSVTFFLKDVEVPRNVQTVH